MPARHDRFTYCEIARTAVDVGAKLGNDPTVSTQPDQSIIAMSYDPSGNVSSVTPPGKRAHLFTYDPAGCRRSLLRPA
jgi:YD repeat-containing protein